jgi:hypothetical protein
MAANLHFRVRSAALAALMLITVWLAVDVATASASDGTFKRTWGWGVKDGTAAFQICIIGCQAGIAGSGDGQFAVPNFVATDSHANVYVNDRNNEQRRSARDGWVRHLGSGVHWEERKSRFSVRSRRG